MAKPILWTAISVQPYFNYIYADIYAADSRINRISHSGEIRREKLGGTLYSSIPGRDLSIAYNHLPTTICTCGFQDQQDQNITGPTLIKPKSSICTCNLVDGTLRIDTVLQEGSHLRNTVSTLITFRKKNDTDNTEVILDLSETCETQGHCITISTTEESGLKETINGGFAAIVVTYLDDSHDKDNGFDGAEYTYPVVKTINGDYSIDEDFEYVLYNGIENLGWDESCIGLYATQDIITTQDIKSGGMRI